jgi:hypothetical protein
MVDYTNGGVRPDWTIKPVKNQENDQTNTPQSKQKLDGDGDEHAPYRKKSAYTANNEADAKPAPSWTKQKDNNTTTPLQEDHDANTEEKHSPLDASAKYHDNPSPINNTPKPQETPSWVTMASFDTSIGDEEYLASNLTDGPVSLPDSLHQEANINSAPVNTVTGLNLSQSMP